MIVGMERIMVLMLFLSWQQQQQQQHLLDQTETQRGITCHTLPYPVNAHDHMHYKSLNPTNTLINRRQLWRIFKWITCSAWLSHRVHIRRLNTRVCDGEAATPSYTITCQLDWDTALLLCFHQAPLDCQNLPSLQHCRWWQWADRNEGWSWSSSGMMFCSGLADSFTKTATQKEQCAFKRSSLIGSCPVTMHLQCRAAFSIENALSPNLTVTVM